ncbi:hypothetical protein D3C77_586810 [compost metagenome]
MLHDLHLLIEFHFTRKCEPIHLRIQGTNTVRQPMWQHRDHPIHQIHTASTVIRFLIKLRLLLHIIANIGNMHAQLDVAIRQTFNVNGIIQILGILAIDRHNYLIAQIPSPLLRNFCRVNFLGCIHRFFHNILGESLRQLMLANDR